MLNQPLRATLYLSMGEARSLAYMAQQFVLKSQEATEEDIRLSIAIMNVYHALLRQQINSTKPVKKTIKKKKSN